MCSRSCGVILTQYSSLRFQLTETIVFVYMGMGVFTGGFKTFDLTFCIIALLACLIGRALNIFLLSWLANLCRKRAKISAKMQVVLWFAGLRGAIAFALSENMPGPHKDVYATATLTICIVTTVCCGGCTEKMLTMFGMKDEPTPQIYSADDAEADELNLRSLSYHPPTPKRRESALGERQRRIQEGIKGAWNRFDDRFLKPLFGGETPILERQGSKDHDSDHETSDWADPSWASNNGFEMSRAHGNGSTHRAFSRGSDGEEEMISLTSRQSR
jgi:solute carrier family 9 (sodium/hydrogen exchanger), member 8